LSATQRGCGPQDDAGLRAQLDPGIVDLVMHLRSLGYRTIDSGDGASKPKDERWNAFPHVTIEAERGPDVFDQLLMATSAAAAHTGRLWRGTLSASCAFTHLGIEVNEAHRSHGPVLILTDLEAEDLAEAAFELDPLTG
jgi:hypothetical protein